MSNKMKGEKSNLTREEKDKVAKLKSGVMLLAALAVVHVAVVGYLAYNDKLRFLTPNIAAKDLTDFGSRLKLVLKFQAPHLLWIWFSVVYVISKRADTPAMNPLEGYEHLTLGAQKHLNNVLEQYVLFFGSQLALIVLEVNSGNLLRLIPALNLLFFVGRVTFWMGYPLKRSFGFMSTFLPMTFTVFYNAYLFAKPFIG